MTVPAGPPLRHLVLDRDGVLNREQDGTWTTSVEAWSWEPGALDGLAAVAAAGWRVSVVTNQSVVGRDLVAADAVEDLHRWLADDLRRRGVDLVGVFACLHAPDEGCTCRKPAPGSVLAAVAASGVPADAACLVGDDGRDLAAATAAGMASILVRTGKGRSIEAGGGWDVAVVDDLASAVTRLQAEGVPPNLAREVGAGGQ